MAQGATPARPEVLTDLSELPPDLRDLVAAARLAALDLKRAEGEYVYRLATLGRAATGRRLSGLSALEACAQSLGIARRTLQQFATIAARWTVFEYRALLGHQDAGTYSLTTSHLVLIAPLARHAREHLIERTLREGLKIRALRKLIARNKCPPDCVPPTDSPPI
jgi:hypothetical protein